MSIKQRRNAAFTLIEIMLVVVIIGILAAVAVPKLAGQAKEAKIRATQSTLRSIETSLGMYEMKAASFPTTEQGLEALVKKPSELGDDEWNGPYLKEGIPKDDFNSELVYRSPGEDGKDYDLFSKGPNKQEGDDDDIYAAKGRKAKE